MTTTPYKILCNIHSFFCQELCYNSDSNVYIWRLSACWKKGSNWTASSWPPAIFGNRDENIRLLEQAFHVTAVCRGSTLKFTGEPEDVDAAIHAVDGMAMLLQNHTPLEEQTVRYCISLARGGEEKRLKELNDDFVAVTAKGKPIHPKTLGQKEYLAAIRSHAITFGVGPAGTGKTYLAVAMAVKAFKSKEVSRIILTRPAVEAGEKLGFLPGDLQTKVDPYLRPLYDGLFDLLGAETFQKLTEKQMIEVAPLAYMRGRTLDDAFIILDEAQNTSPEQMKMFLTRMGAGRRAISEWRRDPDRPAGQEPQRSGGCFAGAAGHRRHCPGVFYRERRGPPPPGAADHQSLRPGRRPPWAESRTIRPRRGGAAGAGYRKLTAAAPAARMEEAPLCPQGFDHQLPEHGQDPVRPAHFDPPQLQRRAGIRKI